MWFERNGRVSKEMKRLIKLYVSLLACFLKASLNIGVHTLKTIGLKFSIAIAENKRNREERRGELPVSH